MDWRLKWFNNWVLFGCWFYLLNLGLRFKTVRVGRLRAEVVDEGLFLGGILFGNGRKSRLSLGGVPGLHLLEGAFLHFLLGCFLGGL